MSCPSDAAARLCSIPMSAPDTDTETAVLTPSTLASQIRRHLRLLGDGKVEGEVRDLSRSGRHCYFAIADEESSVRCIVWGSLWDRLEHKPSEGDQIEAHFSKVDFWAPKGSLSLHVDAVELAGEGRFLRRQAEALARLIADGLCDPERKPTLPRFPRKVGVIAAETGEARVDVVTALQTRFPPVQIVFCPATVQGTNCVGSVIDALATLDEHPDVDVIIVARGGGSASDLYPFSDERLCRAIAHLRTPIVTSIGHTAQRPNCDHVAAACANVPAGAAALVVPDAAELQSRLSGAREVFDRCALRVADERTRANEIRRALGQHDAPGMARLRLQALGSRLGQLEAELPHRRRLREQHERLERAAADRSRQLHEQAATLPSRLQLLRREGDARAAGARQRHRALQQQLQTTLTQLTARVADRRAGVARRLPLLEERTGARIVAARQRLEHGREMIDALDWRQRGLARLLDPDGRPLRQLDQLHPGDALTVELLGGRADATVKAVHPTREPTTKGGTIP